MWLDVKNAFVSRDAFGRRKMLYIIFFDKIKNCHVCLHSKKIVTNAATAAGIEYPALFTFSPYTAKTTLASKS